MEKNYRIVGNAATLGYAKWSAMRINSIGGSEVAAAIGLNPYCRQFELWARKTQHITAKIEQNEAMYWGNRLQSIIANEFEKRHASDKFKVSETKAVFMHKDYDFLTANIDGYVDCGNGEYAVLEVKTTNAWNADSWNDSLPGQAASVPLPYYLQCQYYMLLLNGYDGHKTHGKIRKAYLVCLVGGNCYKEVCIDYDEGVAAVMLAKCIEFWHMVKTNTAPEATGKDNGIMAQVFPTSKDTTIMLGEKFNAVMERYAAVKAEEKRLQDEKAELEVKIKTALGEAAAATCGKWNISYKSSITNRFDATVAKQLLSEADVLKCMKQSQTRTLRVTQKKEKAAAAKGKK